MGLMGLQAIYKGPNTSKKHPQRPVYPYLLRKLPITRPNHVWCTDVTYIPVRRGFRYLVAIMEWATRKVLAWRLSNTLDASFCVKALKEAITKFGKPSRVAAIDLEADWPYTQSIQKTRSYAARPRAVMRLSAFEAICASTC